MDKLDVHLKPGTWEPYHFAIQAAMKLACKKINWYYSMTDLSSVYRIAMNKCLCISWSGTHIYISPSSGTQTQILLTKRMGWRVHWGGGRCCTTSIHFSIWGKSRIECGKPWHAHCCGGSKLTLLFVDVLTLFCFLGWWRQWHCCIWQHLSHCSDWVPFQQVKSLPLETHWERQGASQMVGCKPSHLSKPFLYGIGLPQYTWYHFVLYLFLSLTSFTHHSYIHSSWTCVLPGAPPPLIYMQPAPCNINLCIALHGLLGPQQSYCVWGCTDWCES